MHRSRCQAEHGVSQARGNWETLPVASAKGAAGHERAARELTEFSSDGRLSADRSGDGLEAMGGHDVEAECLDADAARRAEAVPSTVGLAVARSDPKQSRRGVNE
jgi:hypothetical protein